MKLNHWLEAERGRAKALADHLGCSKSMVSQMASGLVRVPPDYYRQIRDFTAGEVGLDDLLPEPKPSNAPEADAHAKPITRFAEPADSPSAGDIRRACSLALPEPSFYSPGPSYFGGRRAGSDRRERPGDRTGRRVEVRRRTERAS